MDGPAVGWKRLEEQPSMDPTTAGDRAFATASPDAAQEAIEFVRFCHRRRRVGWPELYDEMCAVAGRGLYRGYGQDDLAAIGIGFGLFQMPSLAGLVSQVVAEDLERRRRAAAALQASHAGADEASAAPESRPTTGVREAHATLPNEPEAIEVAVPDHRSIRLAVPAGA
jgi:hypothetical protein